MGIPKIFYFDIEKDASSSLSLEDASLSLEDALEQKFHGMAMSEALLYTVKSFVRSFLYKIVADNGIGDVDQWLDVDVCKDNKSEICINARNIKTCLLTMKLCSDVMRCPVDAKEYTNHMGKFILDNETGFVRLIKVEDAECLESRYII